MDWKSRRWFLFVSGDSLCLLRRRLMPSRPARRRHPLQPYLAWTLAGDGTYARRSLSNLATGPGEPGAGAAITATGACNGAHRPSCLWQVIRFGSERRCFGGTRILDRNGYATLDTIERFGPMAAGPDGEVYLIGGTGLYRYDTADLDFAAATLLEPWKPDQFYGARPQKIAVDPPAGGSISRATTHLGHRRTIRKACSWRTSTGQNSK